jgi:hypothetical protein
MRSDEIRENERDKTSCQRMSLTNDCDLRKASSLGLAMIERLQESYRKGVSMIFGFREAKSMMIVD